MVLFVNHGTLDSLMKSLSCLTLSNAILAALDASIAFDKVRHDKLLVILKLI